MASGEANPERVTAAVLIIGDEILSGRTQDTNLRDIARYLGTFGVDVAEARVVPDVQAEIVAALNALREGYDYVITTGGIGPTHDDITADCVAARSSKHLRELEAMVATGDRAVALFVVQRTDCEAFAACHDLDPAFARGLDQAADAVAPA